MRYLSEETMHRIIAFVDEYYNENSYSPTIAEISRSLSLAVGTVHKYLHRMPEMDKLYFDGRHIITPYIEELQGKFHAPVSGDIACGSPIYAEEQHDDMFPIPTDYVGKDEYFWLRANGDSMINAGIDSGDLVLIRKQNTANEGDIVVALMYDEGRTMKEIVAVLNQHGLKNQRGGELNLNSVSRLLQNRFYIGEYKYREVLVPDGIPAIIPKDLFDRVQEKLAKNKKAPARHKAEDDYLLTTKLFCGDCQSLMFGESGTSQSGATYHYYKCSSAKKKTGCNRKPVKKKWIEDAVLDQVKIVLHDDVFIGDVIHKYLEYQQQENTVIPYLEKSLADTQRSIDNLIAAIEQGIITPSTKQRLETLEISKRELEDKILIEKMKRPLRTEDELWAWFRYMRNFDLTRLEERRQLIDVFVNTVFLYSDRFLLTLNFGYGSKTVLFTDIPCSDKVACGRPKITEWVYPIR